MRIIELACTEHPDLTYGAGLTATAECPKCGHGQNVAERTSVYEDWSRTPSEVSWR